MRTVLYLSALRKLWSKIDPVSTLRSLVLMTAPARASLMCSTLTTCSSWPSISNIVPLRKSLVEIIAPSQLRQVLHRQLISRKTKPRDHASRGAGGDALGPKLFARVNVRDVDLDRGHLERLQTVEERQRVVRQRRRVDHDAQCSRHFLLEEIDDLPLVVALKDAHRDAKLARLRPNR